MKDYIIEKYPHMLHGGDYNPDQWWDCPDVLSEDMRLMKLANCNEMTLGIFAWSTLEPDEGCFDFSILDKMMDEIYAAGGRVILATPSGARPAWLADKYPEVLRVNSIGVHSEFGGRHNHCNNSPAYRERVRIINTKLAQRYAQHPALIAWHLSNEYGNATGVAECYCENCRKAFTLWLKNKYKTLEELNHQWWTNFWSQTYTGWEQIVPPGHRSGSCVHGRNLDWKRFVSERTTDFMRAEIEPLRTFSPDTPVTTNLMGFFTGIDYREMSQYIDFVSWDNYPRWRGEMAADIESAIESAMTNDLMRSLKKRPFLLMESTPSCANWHKFNKPKRPGMHELSSLQSVAHGSDSVQYFQWRKSRGCSEKFHGAVVDHVGHENTRVFKEVSALGLRLKKLDEIVGTLPRAETALLYDWDNRWALDDSRGFSNEDKKVFDTLNSFYHPLWKRGIDVDVIGKNDDFSSYKLLIAPMLYMVEETLAEKLCRFVESGGTLLCTYMTGMVNENDLCYLGGFPCGRLRELFGIWNEEIDTLYPGEQNTVLLNDGSTVTAVDYCELIHGNGATVLAHYNSDFYRGRPALTANKYGAGTAYYLAFRDDGSYTDMLVGDLLESAGIRSAFDGALTEGVTAHSRTDGKDVYVFIENYSHSTVILSTKLQWIGVEDREIYKGQVTLNPLSVLILKRKF